MIQLGIWLRDISNKAVKNSDIFIVLIVYFYKFAI